MTVQLVPTSLQLLPLAEEMQHVLSSASPLRAIRFRACSGAEAVEELAEALVPPRATWGDWLGLAREVGPVVGAEPEDVVVLLADRALPQRWFSIHAAPGCVVVDATGWDRFIRPDQTPFALAHLAATNALFTRAYPTMDAWRAHAHEDTRGCIMDLCEAKSGILAKLRAADLCPGCAGRFRGYVAEGRVGRSVFRHAMEVLDGVRRGLLNRDLEEVAAIELEVTVLGRRARAVRVEPFDVEVALPPAGMGLFLVGALRGMRLRHDRMVGRDWEDWNWLVGEFRSSGRGLGAGSRADHPDSGSREANAFKTLLSATRGAFRAHVGAEHEARLLFEESPGRGVRVAPGVKAALRIEDVDLRSHMEERFGVIF